MKTAKRIVLIFIFLVVLASVLTLCSCRKKGDVDTSGMYLIVYHGNGGYLGNKTATERKLFCNPGSKIPNYPADYSVSAYTVSSLGLAMRQGYELLGWYTSAEYTTKANGLYIALETADGYGVYTDDDAGNYVRKPVADENGRFIHVYSAATEESEDHFVLLVPQLDGSSNDLLPVEPGFYVCNSTDDYSGIADDVLRGAYEEAYARGTYTAAGALALSGWQFFDDLDDAGQALFADFPRYAYRMVAAEAGDEPLTHYALAAGHASIYDVFIEDDAGNYAFDGTDFIKVADVDKVPGEQYYTVSEFYVFDGDTTAGLARYDMVVDYWDFATNYVTEDKCTWDGEKFVLHLYAHWVKKSTVYYHYNNGTSQVDTATTRLLEDNRSYAGLRPGEVIGRKEIIPQYADHTFVGWSKSETAYEPWDFENDVFPEGQQELHLYAYYIEGTYTRVVSAKGLGKIKDNPAGKYLIADNIDLGGQTFTVSPLGLTETQVFTGEIVSFGKSITNFTLKLAPNKNKAAAGEVAGTAALIPTACGARISGLTVEYTVACEALKILPVGVDAIQLCASGLVGSVLAGDATLIENCSVTLTAATSPADAYNDPAKCAYHVTVGDVVAAGDNVTVTGCTATVTTDDLTGAALTKVIDRRAADPT